MKNYGNVKKIAVIIIAVCGVVITARIIMKLVKASVKDTGRAVSVSVVEAKKGAVKEVMRFSGVAEGDPQVKIYPTVHGKIEKLELQEGSSVKKGGAILYINRDIAGMDFRLSPVTSPIDGIVTRIYVTDKGSLVSPDKPVAEAADPSTIKTVIYAGEEDIVKIKKGMAAKMTAGYKLAEPLDAYVYSVSPFIDRDTMAGAIVLKAANRNGAIKPGMSVKTEISGEERQSVVLPVNAVLSGAGRVYVYVNDSGRAKTVDVKTGYSDSAGIEIVSGLSGGEQVVVEGNFKLSEGDLLMAENNPEQSQKQ